MDLLNTQFIDEIIKEIKHRKKLVIIGGGEIATEITVAAIENREWDIFIATQEYNEKLPIEKWIYFLRDKKYITNYKKHINFEKFPSFNYEELSDWIIKVDPDVVLLEDIFIQPKEWKRIIDKVNAVNPEILFSPPRESSDFFLSKIHLKYFIENKINEGSLEYCVLDVSQIKKEVQKESGIEYEKFLNFIKYHPECVIKPEKTSSGIGQSFVSDIKDLKEGLKFFEPDQIVSQLRIPNEKILIEEYISNFDEYAIISYIKDNILYTMHPIKYKKYDIKLKDAPGSDLKGKGINPLQCSEMAENIEPPIEVLHKIIEKIHRELNIPFLYTEFLVVNNGHDNKIIINEISHRPDDAGFITLFSLERSQFDLFLESICEQNHEFDRTAIIDQIPDKDLICYTLITEEELKEGPIIFPPPEKNKEKRNIRIYDKKYRFDWDITGFLFIKKDDDINIFIDYFNYLSGLSKESVKIVKDACNRAVFQKKISK